MRRQENDGDGGAGKKKERKTKMGVVGQHQERLVGERIVKEGHARPAQMEASHKTHRPHIKVGKDAEEEDYYDLLPTKINGIIIVFKVND